MYVLSHRYISFFVALPLAFLVIQISLKMVCSGQHSCRALPSSRFESQPCYLKTDCDRHDSIVTTHARLRGLIPGNGKVFSFAPTCTDRIWAPPNFLFNAYTGFFPWAWSGRGLKIHPVPRLDVIKLSPLLDLSPCSAYGRIYLTVSFYSSFVTKKINMKESACYII